MKTQFEHVSVLLEEVVDFAPEATQAILDCTLGGGGHSKRLLEKFPEATLFGIDRDGFAVKASTECLQRYTAQTRLNQANFSDLPSIFSKLGEPLFDYIVADIGLSSEQLARPERGFSFMQEGPLDMRMDPDHQQITAANLLNNAGEQELISILRNYGEERFARKIVGKILASRHIKPLESTTELTELISSSIPRKLQKKGLNPATLTFQALRIAVNNELQELEDLLKQAPLRIKSGGRLAVISFHSLEDRIVKQQFRKWENPCVCPTDLPYCICGKKSLGRVLTRRPVNASKKEVADNPRSRSAHLRVFAFEKTVS
ncbi:MAG TPA: 16S rRNA (cytosine(1402)-N(4))-methyltransferase RsmH [Candidatus Lambdaproteobacteria bacterium]|nr:16S rRNA (cytosine(1402)-N(4))-methyltransferase RsmH [Deltaproteobacteria bacterium]HIA57108.1 16S rRNA (cytosine(1402)-N(4))-methyltransferase RsmH [Candidatus Lambdaproteobacteria bacterium]HIB44900.1 16S rRNA (cytosine(1402)-N(4))-methyltransferase RsmH [Candidatus Lambdaproteobacteria bacterium]HIB94440.1 16S rRNA (cytosine(1402)-N(4))-methyltransferase RsmH [Candidatus Lambdaproteobacteria bacterium]HIN48744.1 16S rRNA (cytosine(1402)-N(4))-methyltransferase RsmH [Deltaproteobacteria b